MTETIDALRARAAVDITRLPEPDLVEPLDFERLREEALDFVRAELGGLDIDLESEPIVKIAEAIAYREMLLRGRVNDAGRAVLLAFASGTDLDHLGALMDVARQDGETDARYRLRIQLAPRAQSVAGPRAAYEFHARDASRWVKDVSVQNPIPGDVLVTILSTVGDGTARERVAETDEAVTFAADGTAALAGRYVSAVTVEHEGTTLSPGVDYVVYADAGVLERLEIGAIPPYADGSGAEVTVSYERAAELELVRETLSADEIRPLSDNVIVQGGTIVTYDVHARIWLYDGPSAEIARRAAENALKDHVRRFHLLGQEITTSRLKAAAHVEGVHEVVLDSPSGNVTAMPDQAPYAGSVTVTVGGRVDF